MVSHIRQTTLRDLHREDICRRPKVPLDAYPAMPLVTHSGRRVLSIVGITQSMVSIAVAGSANRAAFRDREQGDGNQSD